MSDSQQSTYDRIYQSFDSSSVIPEDKTLLPFQVHAIERMLKFLVSGNNAVYNACEPGLGKTIQAIACLNYLESIKTWPEHEKLNGFVNHGQPAFRTLIICPAVMRYTWKDEINSWRVSNSISTISIVESRQFFTSGPWLTSTNEANHLYLIISYDLVRDEGILKFLTSKNWDVLIMDESHYLKSRNSKRTKAVLGSIWDKAKYRIALSGTPFTNNVIDGYTLFSKMLPGKWPNFTTFANTYSFSRKTPWGIKYFGVKNPKDLSSIIRENFYIRYRKEDVLPELPEKIFQCIKLSSSLSVKRPKSDDEIYAAQARAISAQLERGESIKVPASLAEERRLQGLSKVKAVVEFVSGLLEQDIPVVLFGYHKAVISEYQKRLADYKPVVITGETSPKDRDKAVKLFQSSKTLLFIGNIVAAGVGITLTAASTCVFGELSWSPSDIAQSCDRIHRISQKNSVNIFYFEVENSLDEMISRTLISKAKAIASIVDA